MFIVTVIFVVIIISIAYPISFLFLILFFVTIIPDSMIVNILYVALSSNELVEMSFSTCLLSKLTLIF